MYLGIDLGATNLRGALADDTTTIATRTVSTPTQDGEAVLDAVTDTTTQLCDGHGIAPTDLSGVGVGTIGPLDGDTVVDPPNLSRVSRIPLGDTLRSLTASKVTVRNDAIVGLIAEQQSGAPPNTVYVTLSTGIGAGAAVDGHRLTGANGNAAEVGHIVVDPDHTLACGCGGRGHWEAYCGGAAIPRFATHLKQTTAVHTDIPVEDDDCDAATLLDATDTDPLAATIADHIATYNAIGFAAITHAYDPTAIIVGGSVAKQHPTLMIEGALDRIDAYLIRDPPTISLTEHTNPVLTGAVTLARHSE